MQYFSQQAINIDKCVIGVVADVTNWVCRKYISADAVSEPETNEQRHHLLSTEK